VTGPTGSTGQAGTPVDLATVLATGNTTGSGPEQNILISEGQRVDSETPAVLSIGTVTAITPGVVFGGASIPVTMTGWVNVGATTRAVAQGDLSAGSSASESELFFSASGRTLSLIPVTTSDDCILRVGTGTGTGTGAGAFYILTNGTTQATIKGANGSTGGIGSNLDIRPHPAPVQEYAFQEQQGGDLTCAGGAGLSDGASGGTAGTFTMRGGIVGRFGTSDAGPAEFILGGGTRSGAGGGNAIITGGKWADSSGAGVPGGNVLLYGGNATTGRGGQATVRSGGTDTGTAGDVTVDSGTITTGTPGGVFMGHNNAQSVNISRPAGALGFFGVTAAAQSLPYSRDAVVTGTRTLYSSAAATPENTNQVLSAVIQDLQECGLIG
jgi:hypothetical protein